MDRRHRKERPNGRARRDRWSATAPHRPTLGTSAKDLKPVPRRQLTPGTVVFAHIPFVEQDRWKARPALVVAAVGDTVTVAPITGSHRPGLGAVSLIDWVDAGLNKPSTVQNRTVELSRFGDITSVVGHLTEDDAARCAHLG